MRGPARAGGLSLSALSRRAALGVIGASAVGWAVLPRKARSREGVPAGRVVIDYWEKWTGLEGEALKRVVDRFNTQVQDRIWVRLTPVSEIKSKAMVAIAGGDPPDLVGVFSFNVPQYSEAGAVYSIPQLESEFGGARVDAGAYAPAVLKLLSHAGKQWAGATSIYNLALYYNRSMFRENGLDPERPPRVVPELDEMADKLLVREGVAGTVGTGKIARAGFLPNLPEWWPYFWPIMFGGRLYDPVNNRAELTDAGSVTAYQWVQAAAKRVGVEEGSAFSSSFGRSMHSPNDPFISGKTAMIVTGPWIANFIKKYNPQLDYGATPVPVGEGLYDAARPLGMLEADVLMVPKGARHPKEAFAFLAWMQSQEALEMLALEHGKSSPLRATTEWFRKNHPNRRVDVHDAITASDRVQILPQTRVWQAYADLTLGMFDSVWRGADVRATLADVEKRAQGMMDRAEDLKLRRSGGAGRGA